MRVTPRYSVDRPSSLTIVKAACAAFLQFNGVYDVNALRTGSAVCPGDPRVNL